MKDKWIERPELAKLWASQCNNPNPDMRNHQAWTLNGIIRVLYSEDNTPKWGWLKHISISHSGRYPTWSEILIAKEKFFGDIDVMMILPKREDYVNVHPNCFHLLETPEPWGLR